MMLRYRTEAFSGEGYRDPAEVMAFETFTLCNADILDYLSEHQLKGTPISKEMRNLSDELYRNGFIDDFGEEDQIEFFKRVVDELCAVKGKKISYCLWLADLNTVLYHYGKFAGEEPFEVDAYETGDEILSDIGYDGALYGYIDPPKIEATTMYRDGAVLGCN